MERPRKGPFFTNRERTGNQPEQHAGSHCQKAGFRDSPPRACNTRGENPVKESYVTGSVSLNCPIAEQLQGNSSTHIPALTYISYKTYKSQMPVDMSHFRVLDFTTQ